MKLFVTSVQIENDAGEPQAEVETFDEGAASIKLHEVTHNAQTWRELADAIGRVVEMLELKG